MAGGNAIGHGAVVLTASSDKLFAGLDQAEGKIKGFAAKADHNFANVGKGIGGKAGGFVSKFTNSFVGRKLLGTPEHDAKTGEYLGRIGGLLGKIKGAAGGAKGAIGGLFKSLAMGGGAALALKGYDLLFDLPDKIKELKEGLADGESAPWLDHILKTFKDVGDTLKGFAVGALGAFAPTITFVGDLIMDTFDRLEPVITDVFSALEVGLYVGAELFGVIIDLIADVIESVDGWLKETLSLSGGTEDAGDIMFGVIRKLGKGFAYLWDGIKYGAGAVSWVAGKVVQNFATVITKLGDMIAKVADLAKALPDSLRTRLGLDGLDKAAAEVRGWGATVDNAGKDMEAWGKRQMDSFGEGAKQWDAWLDGVEQRFRDRREKMQQAIAEPMKETKLAGATTKGSAEAYSIIAKFQGANTVADTNAKHQLATQKQMLVALKSLEVILKARPPMPSI